MGRSVWLKRLVLVLSISAESSIAVATVIPKVGQVPALALGTGYDSQTRMFRSRCVQGSYGFAGAQVGTLDLEHSLDQDRYHDEVSATAGAGVNLFLFGGEVKITVGHQQAAGSYNENLVYIAESHGKEALLDQPSVSAFGYDAARDPGYVRHACGDEYISKVKLGAKLFLTASYNFGSLELKNEVITKVKFSVLGFSKTVTHINAWSEVLAHSSVTIDAWQVGGLPERLTALKDSIPVKTCLLNNLAPCQDIVNRLMAYATAPDGLSAQIGSLTYDPDHPEQSLAILGYETRRYIDAGFTELAPAPSPVMTYETQEALDRLGQTWAQLEKDRIRLEELPKIFAAQPEEILAWKRLKDGPIRVNLGLVRAAIDRCYQQPASCLAIEQEYSAQAQSFDRALLAREIRFADVCLKPNTLQQPLVQRLLQEADTTDCLQAEGRLNNKTSLTLKRLTLEDVGPLRGFTQLRTLDLSHNKLTDITALRSLPQLQRLLLRNNDLTQIDALASLKNLTTLDLAYNHVTALNPLYQVPLRSLAAYGNPLFNVDPKRFTQLQIAQWTDTDACQMEIDRLLRLRLLSLQTANTYRELDMGPVYTSYERPEVGFNWYNCIVAAKQFDGSLLP